MVWNFPANALHNPQDGRAGVATQAVGSAPVFPRLQVTKATMGIQPELQRVALSISQAAGNSERALCTDSLGKQGTVMVNTDRQLARSRASWGDL